MFKIVAKRELGPDVFELTVQAPRIAKARKAGQFVIVRTDDKAERVPLTIADVDRKAGTIRLIVQRVGVSTRMLGGLEPGDSIRDMAGPLGQPTEIEKFGHAVVVGGGVGTAVVYPQAVALKEAGNYVTAVIGARTKDLLLLEEPLRAVADEVVVCTDDGSYGRKGFVTQALADLVARTDRPVNAVFAAGPVVMMKAVANVTRAAGIKTVVSLNPIMVDGTGMCGGCRVTVGGQMRFACVDGPEFDGHKVDYDELSDRLSTYRPQERNLVDAHGEGGCKLDERLARMKTETKK
jgi:ferredoxin/flavodoxin---NADP+ reductase